MHFRDWQLYKFDQWHPSCNPAKLGTRTEWRVDQTGISFFQRLQSSWESCYLLWGSDKPKSISIPISKFGVYLCGAKRQPPPVWNWAGLPTIAAKAKAFAGGLSSGLGAIHGHAWGTKWAQVTSEIFWSCQQWYSHWCKSEIVFHGVTMMAFAGKSTVNPWGVESVVGHGMSLIQAHLWEKYVPILMGPRTQKIMLKLFFGWLLCDLFYMFDLGNMN